MSMPIYVNKVLYDDWAQAPAIDGLVFVDQLNDIPPVGELFYFGTINDCQRLLRTRDYPDVWFDYQPMSVSQYYWYLQDLQLNWPSGHFKHVGHLTNADLGKFCRSDSSDKLWAGQLLTEPTMEILKDLQKKNLLLFLADAQTIQQEFRCWVDEGELIACSAYSPRHDMFEIKYKTRVCAYHLPALQEVVQACCDRFTVGSIVIDVGINANGNYKVIELNCFSTSGFNDPEAFLKVIRHTKEEIMKL